MRFHHLSIQAFGPFSGKIDIDFSVLGNNPIYLIEGPTGAGKSSILHAICFALYGETTDIERREKSLRCDHASDSVPTEVSLEFEVNRQVYRITRSPAQERLKKSGEGKTIQSASAHLRKLDEHGVEETLTAQKKTEANDEIKRITKLNVDQFRQVMVLPQGKFRELLLAKSDKRQEILSTLFETEKYKRIEELLNQKAKTVRDELKELENARERTLSNAEVRDSEELAESVKAAKVAKAQSQELRDKNDEAQKTATKELEKANSLDKDFREMVDKEKELKVLNAARSIYMANKQKVEKADLANKAKPKFDAWSATKNELLEAVDELGSSQRELKECAKRATAARKNLKQAEDSHKKVPSMISERKKLEEFSIVLNEIEEWEDELKSLEEEKKSSLAGLAACKENGEIFQAKLVEQTKEHDRLNQLVKSNPNIALKISQLETLLAQRSELDDLTKGARELEKDKQESDVYLKNRESELFVKRKEFEEQRRLHSAFELARTLKTNTPCPVCGSLQHPSPQIEKEAEQESLNVDALDDEDVA